MLRGSCSIADQAQQVLFIAAGSLATAQNAVGGYRHTYYLTEQEIVTALEINYMLRAVVIVVYIPSKAAVGGLILRLTHRQRMWQRYVVWVVIILTALLNALNTIFNFVQCSPVEANWDPSARKNATCWPIEAQLDFAYFQCGMFQSLYIDAFVADRIQWRTSSQMRFSQSYLSHSWPS